jgi:hypothetical protein
VEPDGYGFVPFSVEAYGSFGQPAMQLLHQLGDEAAGTGGASQASFVLGALRELSVGLVRGNFWLHHATAGMLAKLVAVALGRAPASPHMDDCMVE